MKHITDVSIGEEIFDYEFLYILFYSFMTKISGSRQKKVPER